MSDDLHKTIKGGPKVGTLAFSLEEIQFLIEQEKFDLADERIAALASQYPDDAGLKVAVDRLREARAQALRSPRHKAGTRTAVKTPTPPAAGMPPKRRP